MTGLLHTTGLAGATYGGSAQQPGGASGLHQTTEDAVENAGATPVHGLGLGRTLSGSARQTAIEPGGSRHTSERGRLTLSGLPAQRLGPPFTATTGLLADWQTVLLPVLDTLNITMDRVTRPGNLRLTARLPEADPIVTQPSTAYALTQA